MTTPAQQDCRDAADLIERHGWSPGISKDGYCALGALYKICGRLETTRFTDATHLMKAVIGDWNIAKWNDAQTSAEPVIAALRKAGGL